MLFTSGRIRDLASADSIQVSEMLFGWKEHDGSLCLLEESRPCHYVRTCVWLDIRVKDKGVGDGGTFTT
jgi:hypothetical protein